MREGILAADGSDRDREAPEAGAPDLSCTFVLLTAAGLCASCCPRPSLFKRNIVTSVCWRTPHTHSAACEGGRPLRLREASDMPWLCLSYADWTLTTVVVPILPPLLSKQGVSDGAVFLLFASKVRVPSQRARAATCTRVVTVRLAAGSRRAARRAQHGATPTPRGAAAGRGAGPGQPLDRSRGRQVWSAAAHAVLARGAGGVHAQLRARAHGIFARPARGLVSARMLGGQPRRQPRHRLSRGRSSKARVLTRVRVCTVRARTQTWTSACLFATWYSVWHMQCACSCGRGPSIEVVVRR